MALFAALALLAPAGVARAGTVSVDGDTIVFAGDAVRNDVSIDLGSQGDGTPVWVVSDHAVPPAPGAGCSPGPVAAAVWCAQTGETRFRADLGDGDDTLAVDSALSGGGTADGGPGNDLLSAMTGPVSFTGGDGDDKLMGTNADDVLDGGPGSDLVFGNGGNDTLLLRDGAVDHFGCGDGVDHVIADVVDRADVGDASGQPGCETVDLPVLAPPPLAAPRLTVATRPSARAVLRGGLRVRVGIEGASGVVATPTAGGLRLARGEAAGAGVVVLRATARGRRHLHAGLRALLRVVAVDARGRRAVATRTLTLRR